MKREKREKRVVDKKIPMRREWVILIISIVLFSCCYMYTDLPFSSTAGIRLLNCIADGNLPMFYWSHYPGVENSVLADGSAGGAYDILIYVIFAVYNFPLWLWEKITGLSFLLYYPLRVYIKGIVWLFSGMSAYFVYKIALQCEVEKENAIWAPLLFLSSGIFFATEVTIGGYDIISVAFSLLGIYGYLKKDNKCFLISFGIAISTKLFALWLFIPLLLLKEKKIWKILLEFLFTISFIIIPKAYFTIASKSRIAQQVKTIATENSGNNTGATQTAAVNDMIAHVDIINDALFPTDYTAVYTFFSIKNLPLVFVGMFAIWIFCYLIKRELKAVEVVYLCALVMSVFIITVKNHPYWGILLVPYLALMLVTNPIRIKENLFLELLISIGYVMNKAILYPWCFGMAQIERMVGPNYVFSYDRENTNTSRLGVEGLVYELSQKVGISENNIAHVFSALFVVSVVFFLVLNRPDKLEEKSVYIGDTEEFRTSVWTRFLFSLFVAVMPIIGLLMYASPYDWGSVR